MIASAVLASLIFLSAVPLITAKIIVDIMLFFLSFRIQKDWGFRQGVRADAKEKS